MYSKQEVSRLKQEFWTRFGQYMKPVPSAGGERINWSNYKTGVPHIYFRMRAEREYASVGIDLSNPNSELRLQQYDQFGNVKGMLHEMLGEAWTWEQSAVDENHKTISRISTSLQGVNVCNEADWPTIISFLKPRIIALDEFWNDARLLFEQ